MKAKIAQQVLGLAEYYDKTLSPGQIEMFVDDLEGIDFEQLKIAAKRYRTDPANVFFPLPAKLIALVEQNDGRPGVEEAWALCPKDENISVIWTEEIREAFAACSPLMYEDPIAARMAFKEKYTTMLQRARQDGIKVKWTPSFGLDKIGRELALREAIDKNRITITHARKIMPEFEIRKELIKIGETSEFKEIQKLIGGVFK